MRGRLSEKCDHQGIGQKRLQPCLCLGLLRFGGFRFIDLLDETGEVGFNLLEVPIADLQLTARLDTANCVAGRFQVWSPSRVCHRYRTPLPLFSQERDEASAAGAPGQVLSAEACVDNCRSLLRTGACLFTEALEVFTLGAEAELHIAD